MKKGDKVYITKLECLNLDIPFDTEFTVIDILENVDCPIVLNSEKFGKDWVEFFREGDIA